MTLPSASAVAAVEAGFVDEGEIRERDTLGAYDPETNTQPTIEGALVWSGACQIAEAGTAGRDLLRGGEREVEHPYTVSISRTVTGINPGLIFRATTSQDLDLVDVPLIIRFVRRGTRRARTQLLCDLLQAVSD